MAENFYVSIVDNSGRMRTCLADIIHSAGMNVEAFSDAASFIRRLPQKVPDCALLSYRLSGISGPEVHDFMLSHDLWIPIIFLIDYKDFPDSIREAKKRDADFLSKPVHRTELMQSLKSAHDRIISIKNFNDQQRAVLSHWRKLTPREREVLDHVLGGYLNKQTASRLGIAEKTVKVHRQRVMEKMNARSVAQLVRQCEMAGIHPRQIR